MRKLACFVLAMVWGHACAFGAPLSVVDLIFILRDGAACAAAVDPNAVIAVVDSEGFVLVVYGVSGTPTQTQAADAISKAGTAAFLSSNQNAFTSRTAGYIIQDHFPPTINDASPGPLVGVGFSNLPFSDINRFRIPSSPNTPIAGTSLSGTPGGVPLYSNGLLVGGVGVTGSGLAGYVPAADPDEQVALAAQTGYGPATAIEATGVLINGIRLPYTNSYGFIQLPVILNPANLLSTFPPTASRGVPANPVVPAALGGNPGEIRNPIVGSTLPPIAGQPHLSVAEVTQIIASAAAQALTIRAAIRLPVGVPAQFFIAVVDNPNAPGTPPPVLGVYRTNGAPIFSYDVSVQKARTALFFSSNQMALSTRTVGFLGVDLYPPGINETQPGPYFGLQERYSAGTATAPDSNLPNGITIFPGGFPLYRNGVLIGAIGVSGDGVDQDDLDAAAGTVNFLAPMNIRADQFIFRGARLPYAKFPTNPAL